MIRTALSALAMLPALAPLAFSTTAAAQQAPAIQKEPDAVDVITTPAGDLNLRKDEIPPLLLAAQQDPYGLAGISRCTDITAEVSRLDAVLGDDIDVAQSTSKPSAGRVAQSVVGSFIPFRGLIREISGASEQERKQQYAIYAGSARRSFLKGIGQQRGCRWPARSATPQMLAEVAERNAAKVQEKK